MHATRWNRIVPAALVLALAAGAWYRTAGPHGGVPETAMSASPAAASAPVPADGAGPGWLSGSLPFPSSETSAEYLVQQWQRLSASREPRDAYHAYRLVRACMDVQQPAQAAPVVPVDNILADVKDQAAFCAGMTQRMRMDRIPLLEQAARAGVDGAMAALVEEGPFGDPTALQTRPDDPLVKEWKARVGQMLGEQAGQGDWTSLYLLFTGFAFDNPAIAVDRQSALAYGLALRDIVVRLDGMTEDEAIPFNGPFLEQVKAGLNTEQQSRAALQAAAIVDTARLRRMQAQRPTL